MSKKTKIAKFFTESFKLIGRRINEEKFIRILSIEILDEEKEFS